ncbi:hypothetical protein ACNOYE_19475 [Nannocystaceae bacterium ST9]
MPRRLVIVRLSEGSVLADEGERVHVDPPALSAIRLVFGVGSLPEREPTSSEEFIPVYTVGIPVVSQGGLDPDGVYEFDAGAQLELLRGRATRRCWAVRLELEFVQSAEAIASADLWFEVDWSSEGPELTTLGPERGATLPGGGRALTIASTPVTDIAAARALGGRFSARLRDADPRSPNARVESPSCVVELSTRHYEFEPEGPSPT